MGLAGETNEMTDNYISELPSKVCVRTMFLYLTRKCDEHCVIQIPSCDKGRKEVYLIMLLQEEEIKAFINKPNVVNQPNKENCRFMWARLEELV